ncbi:hypothetical protein [Bradyrhizobium sp. LHD-71]|uniref:portal protein n=1 Tax=Bradyrhizobium sp. LHD-71 TaxID=3072141 RepID=UPI00280EE2C0|nr:hypothetical protein [Bradyrhizobium sp. LHD-71]MDQ8730548.1 hypothetical protein [Bradyrhizobium sp. LHD-71]
MTQTSPGLLDVGDLCRMFEEAEDASLSARKEAERDRDYVDGRQLTSEELAEYARRGQPPVIDNRIKTKIDYLVGLEKQQRVKPKAFPRTPRHEADADAATEALRYVAESEDYEARRSAVWRNMLVEGVGGIRIHVEPARFAPPLDPMGSSALTSQELQIRVQRIAWDRLFFDPHSSEADFSDAGYLGIVTWMDYADALSMYPDAREILDTTLSSAPSDTYDDKPKFSHWADGKRRRVRICQIWIRRGGEWFFAEYTKGGILKGGPSPYLTDKGESDCELILQSAYVDRDNNRYGLVREMVSLQDEVNKRRSKSLHLLNTAQVVYETGAVADIQAFRKEAVRPDGTMEVAPGALANRQIEFRTRDDLATAHFQLLQEAKTAIDVKGPNATEMGDRTGGVIPASGRAILASQQGGMIQIGDLLDNLRHLDRRVFRSLWARVRQFWTAETWVRVTDDERNVKWLGLNLDPFAIAQINMRARAFPDEARATLAGVTGPLATLDCDIIIDDAPDGLTPQIEQFQSLVELKKFDTAGEIPFRAIVRAMPNLKDKQAFLKDMDAQAQRKAEAGQGMQALQLRGAQAEVAETESKVVSNVAKAYASARLAS